MNGGEFDAYLLATRVRRGYRGMVTSGKISWPEAVRAWVEKYGSGIELTDERVTTVVTLILKQIDRAEGAKPKLIVPEPKKMAPQPPALKGRRIIKGEFPGTHVPTEE